MRKCITYMCTALGSFMLITALLVLSIEMFAVNQDFFESEYDQLGTADHIGISRQDLSQVTRNLLAYTTGSRDSLDMQAKINGEYREVFGQREKTHMVDVKALYLAARNVRAWFFVGAAVLIVLAFAISGRKALLWLCRSFLCVSGVFVVVVAAIGIYAASDFTAFWTSFHHVFFTNDLWLLNPTDVLIMMVPEQFFSDLVTKIIIRFVSIFLTLNIAAAAGARISKKLQAAREA